MSISPKPHIPHRVGKLAREHGYRLPLQICESAAGFYLGTADDSGPVSRESVEYFSTPEQAQHALETGVWNQREHA